MSTSLLSSLFHNFFLSSFSASNEDNALNASETRLLITGLFLIGFIIAGSILNFTGKRYREPYNFSVIYISTVVVANLLVSFNPYVEINYGQIMLLILSMFALRLFFHVLPRAPHFMIAGLAGAAVSSFIGSFAVPMLTSEYSSAVYPVIAVVGAVINGVFCWLWENVVVMSSTIIIGSLYGFCMGLFGFFSFVLLGIMFQAGLGNIAKNKTTASHITSPV